MGVASKLFGAAAAGLALTAPSAALASAGESGVCHKTSELRACVQDVVTEPGLIAATLQIENRSSRVRIFTVGFSASNFAYVGPAGSADPPASPDSPPPQAISRVGGETTWWEQRTYPPGSLPCEQFEGDELDGRPLRWSTRIGLRIQPKSVFQLPLRYIAGFADAGHHVRLRFKFNRTKIDFPGQPLPNLRRPFRFVSTRISVPACIPPSG